MINENTNLNNTEAYYASIGMSRDMVNDLRPEKPLHSFNSLQNRETGIIRIDDKMEMDLPHGGSSNSGGKPEGGFIEYPKDDVAIVIPEKEGDKTNNNGNANTSNSGGDSNKDIQENRQGKKENDTKQEMQNNNQQPQQVKANFALPLIGLAILGLILLVDNK